MKAAEHCYMYMYENSVRREYCIQTFAQQQPRSPLRSVCQTTRYRAQQHAERAEGRSTVDT